MPSLVRSSFGMGATQPEHGQAVAMVEGIEGFRVELGIDNRSKAYVGQATGTPVDYTAEVDWLDPDTRSIPTNRGDGSPDGAFISCTDLDPCTVDELMNVTAVKIHLLVRSREPSRGYTDTKTYQVGSTTMGPYDDGFKRHVYTSTVRLPNVAGRRQTP
jgi:type IV pilus assembly protein PilW